MSERERELCEIAEKMTLHRTGMQPSDWEPLQRLGFDENACLEVAHLVAMFNYVTVMADAFGLQPTESRNWQPGSWPGE